MGVTNKSINIIQIFIKLIRLLVGLFICGFVLFFLYKMFFSNNEIAISKAAVNKPVVAHETKISYTPPQFSPIGSDWPKVSSHINGYPIKKLGGLGSIKINNKKGDSDLFVILLDHNKSPVRHLFIKNGDQFLLSNIQKGIYYLTYQNLKYGVYQISESIPLDETTSALGKKYSKVEIKMQKVRGGNFSTADLSLKEFNRFIIKRM